MYKYSYISKLFWYFQSETIKKITAKVISIIDASAVPEEGAPCQAPKGT